MEPCLEGESLLKLSRNTALSKNILTPALHTVIGFDGTGVVAPQQQHF